VSPQYIRVACEASLRRLAIDTIDLYQLHLNDYPAERVAPVVATLEALVAEGKIRAYGWSTDFPERIEAMAELGKHCVSVQFERNVLVNGGTMHTTAAKLGLSATINRGPLGMGLLTGKFSAGQQLATSDIRAKTPEWMQYFHDGVPAPALAAKLERVRNLLTVNERSLAQGALAWLLTESSLNLPIPGFRTRAQVRANVAALSFPPLPAEAMAEISRLLA
jgi:aryl-alcohol dehydrogenase-like predicted oxidoreductase